MRHTILKLFCLFFTLSILIMPCKVYAAVSEGSKMELSKPVTVKAAIPEFFSSPVTIIYKNSDNSYTFTLTSDNDYTCELSIEPGEYTVAEVQTDNNYRVKCYEKLTEQSETVLVYVQPNEPIEDGMIKVIGSVSVPVGFDDDIVCTYTSDEGNSFSITYTKDNGYSGTATVARDNYSLSECNVPNGFSINVHNLNLTEEQSPYIYKDEIIPPTLNDFNISINANAALDTDVFVICTCEGAEKTLKLSKTNNYEANLSTTDTGIEITDIQCSDISVSFEYLQNADGSITITATKAVEQPSEEQPTEEPANNLPLIPIIIIVALLAVIIALASRHHKSNKADKPKKIKPVKTKVAKEKKEKTDKKEKQEPVHSEPETAKPEYLVAPVEKEKSNYNPEEHDYTKLENIPEEVPQKEEIKVETPQKVEEPKPEKIDFGEIKDVTGMEIEEESETFDIDTEAMYATSKYKGMFDSNVVKMTQSDGDDGDDDIFVIPAEHDTVDIEEINV